MSKKKINELVEFLGKLPSVKDVHFENKNGDWWVMLHLDIFNPYAWNVIQELAFVLNNVAITERFPAIFYPKSPPPYLNGGPADFLSWIIENGDKGFTPEILVEQLKNYLPDPEDLEEWYLDEPSDFEELE